jgi:flagellar basal-body rod modification protein FlgD
MQTSAASAVTGRQDQQNPSGKDALEDVGMDEFLKMMITELQHQDPLNPMDNAQMLQQISQIRQIAASDRLSKTLDAVMLGQSMATAGSLLGKNIEGMTDRGDKVSGRVDKVSVVNGIPKLLVGDQEIDLKNVSTMLPQ